MSRQAIVRHINAGVETAPKHKQEVDDFKAAFSRIALAAEARVVAVTFKGRQSAARWVNWRLPLAAKLLTLVDYDGQCERARTTHELVQLDYYEFTAAVRKGAISSRDMHWILTHALGLQAQEIAHPEVCARGLNDKEWKVTVKGEQCPKILRSKAYVELDQAAFMIHHHNINVNWPCANCNSPNHPTRVCKVTAADLSQHHKEYNVRLSGTLPSKEDGGGAVLTKGKLPTTLEQLQELLRQETTQKRNRSGNKKDTHPKPKSPRKQTQSPSKKGTACDGDVPSLPSEWEQHRRPAATPKDLSMVQAMDEDDGTNTETETPEQSQEVTTEECKWNQDEHSGIHEATDIHQADADDGGFQQEQDYEMEEEAEHSGNATGGGLGPVQEIVDKIPAEATETRGRLSARRILKRGNPGRGHNRHAQPFLSKDNVRSTAKGFSADMNTGKDRNKSQSPMRREREEAGPEAGSVRKEMRTTHKRERGTRLLSPIKKTGSRSPSEGDKFTKQRYMHQYLLKALNKPVQPQPEREGEEYKTVEIEEPTKDQSLTAKETVHPGSEHKRQGGAVIEEEEDDCTFVGTNPADDVPPPGNAD